MAAPIVELTNDVAAKLATATGFTFTRRISATFNKTELAGGKWSVLSAADIQASKAKQVDRSTLTVDVAYQEPLPEKTEAYPDPRENLEWFDSRMVLLETVKSLFRGGGALRNARYAPGTAFAFQSMEHSPIYRPDLMNDESIFTSAIRLEFFGEIESA